MGMKKLSIIVAILSLATVTHADNKIAGDSTVTAHVKASMGLAIDAVTHDVHMKDDGTTTTIVIPTSSFKTGIDLRDKHMHDAVETLRYPVVVLEVKNVDLKASGRSKCDLTFHGVKKTVDVRYDVIGDTVLGEIDVNLEDFSVDPPRYAGMSVRPVVHITSKLQVTR